MVTNILAGKTSKRAKRFADASPEVSSGTLQENFWQEQAKLLRVMAHPTRLAILETLCERPHCVKHLNSLIDVAQPHLSQHMAALRKAELVACHACGPVRCYYMLRPTLVKRMIRLLRQDHPTKQRDGRSVIREARRGWEAHSGGLCSDKGLAE